MMLNFEVLESYEVIYESSFSKYGIQHDENNWRSKYFGLRGRIWIIRRKDSQYFQWNPVRNKTKEIIVNRGIVSSNDEYKILGNKLIIDTVNSKYIFRIISGSDHSIVPTIR